VNYSTVAILCRRDSFLLLIHPRESVARGESDGTGIFATPLTEQGKDKISKSFKGLFFLKGIDGILSHIGNERIDTPIYGKESFACCSKEGGLRGVLLVPCWMPGRFHAACTQHPDSISVILNTL